MAKNKEQLVDILQKLLLIHKWIQWILPIFK